jgi:hypothetical protein
LTSVDAVEKVGLSGSESGLVLLEVVVAEFWDGRVSVFAVSDWEFMVLAMLMREDW